MPRPTQDQIDARAIADMAQAIKAVAREEMAKRGTAGLSLRAIARHLNITAPAIYNYYSRLDDLITALVVDAFTDLAAAMESADTHSSHADCGTRIWVMVAAYRQWAIANPIDFQLIYGNPIPGYVAPAEVTVPLARQPFMGIFRCMLQAYSSGELNLPPEYEKVPPEMALAATQWSRDTGFDMPEALVGLLMSGWARIHGMVMLELFHHSQPLIGSGEAFYRYEMEAMLTRMGLTIA